MGQLVQPKTDVFCCKMFPISWKVLKFFHVTAVKEFILRDFTVVYLCVCVCARVMVSGAADPPPPRPRRWAERPGFLG